MKYRVNFARTTWASVFVEAETEDEAVEAAFEELPEFTARESGWGSFGKWSADADDWMTVDEFYGPEYETGQHGPVVGEDTR
ncbi:hypothetical protein [Spirillospora sp. NPDC047279]|uniref:hypothetical protein n=1 Tax=Spirillospora sp. NPDC047279 TaxID=3155478 RepID=UPI0033EE799F